MLLHTWIRGLSALVMASAVTVLAASAGTRLDVTSEQIHSLSNDTRKLITSLDPRKPVFIQGYFSPDVPRSYLDVRSNLVAFLRELDAAGREAIETRIIETVKYSPEACEARAVRLFGIARSICNLSCGRSRISHTIL